MMQNLIRQFSARPKRFISLRNKVTTTNASENVLENISALEATEVVEETEQALAEEIEKKRNKSRLREQHRNLLHNTMPYSEPAEEFHKTVKYQRKMYALYGNQSGVYPGICWPTKDEVESIQEYEKVAFPLTVQQLIRQSAQRKKEAEEIQQKRQEEIAKKYAKLGQWKKELKDKIAKKEADARAVKDRKDRLVEEVRRHFGYKIDPRDDKFKELLEQKEKAEKKAMKEAKRKVKEAKLIAKLQQNKAEAKTSEVSEERKEAAKENQ